jgi:hypothetical protein
MEEEREERVTTADLDELFFELEQMKIYIDEGYDCGEDGSAINLGILLLLIKIALAKLQYYSAKYDFKVPIDDLFYVDDAVKFVTAKALFDESVKKERKMAISKIENEALEIKRLQSKAMELWRGLMVDNDVIRGQAEKYKKAMNDAGLKLSDNPLFEVHKVVQTPDFWAPKEETPEDGEEA